MQSPASNKYNINMKSVEAKTPCPLVAGVEKSRFVRIKISKPEGPGVGQYKDANAKHIEANDTRSANYTFSKNKRPRIIEEVVLSRGYVPGVGKYENVGK